MMKIVMAMVVIRMVPVTLKEQRLFHEKVLHVP
jgi:hypothetical protein